MQTKLAPTMRLRSHVILMFAASSHTCRIIRLFGGGRIAAASSSLCRYFLVNYLFISRWMSVDVPGVLRLVGTTVRPIALPDQDIDLLRSGLDRRRAEPHPYIKIGDRVRIKRGILAGLEGLVSRGKSLRVVISLDAILKSVAVEVDWDEVETIAGTALRPCSA